MVAATDIDVMEAVKAQIANRPFNASWAAVDLLSALKFKLIPRLPRKLKKALKKYGRNSW